MPDLTIQICQACGAPSTAGHTHDLGHADVHELCGACVEVSDAIARLAYVNDAAGRDERRARVRRILELLEWADELCDERFGDEPSRLAEWFRPDEEAA